MRASLGELPARLRERLETSYGATPYDADVLVNQGRPLVDYFIELAEACGDGKAASTWVQQDVLRVLNERQIGVEQFPVPAARLAELVRAVVDGALTTGRAREVLGAMIDSGKSLEEAMRGLGIEEVDETELRNLCRELLAAHPNVVEQVRQGKTKAVGALVGQAKRRNPNVHPGRVQEIFLEMIGAT